MLIKKPSSTNMKETNKQLHQEKIKKGIGYPGSFYINVDREDFFYSKRHNTPEMLPPLNRDEAIKSLTFLQDTTSEQSLCRSCVNWEKRSLQLTKINPRP